MSFFTNCQLNTMKPSTHSDIICVQNQYASLLRSFISCAAAWTFNSAFSSPELLHFECWRNIFDILFLKNVPLPLRGYLASHKTRACCLKQISIGVTLLWQINCGTLKASENSCDTLWRFGSNSRFCHRWMSWTWIYFCKNLQSVFIKNFRRTKIIPKMMCLTRFYTFIKQHM